MHQAYLQPREPLEDAAKNQMRRGDRRLQRIVDEIVQVVAIKALFGPAERRVDHQKRTERLRLGPEWIESGVIEKTLRPERGVDLSAKQSKVAHQPAQHRSGALRPSHWGGADADEAIRILAKDARYPLVQGFG